MAAESEEVVAEEVIETAPETPKGGSLLEGKGTITSPFDTFYGENAPEFSDPTIKDWVSKQKNGNGFEKGLIGLRKLASQKGYEPPADDADDETKQAFQQQMRKLNRIPESIDGYEIDFGEESGLDEDTQNAIKQFGFSWRLAVLLYECCSVPA